MDPAWIIAAATVVAALMAAGAMVISLLALRTPKHRLFLSLWEEYSAREMLEALRELYRFWDSCHGDPHTVVESYRKKLAVNDPLHHQRRIVSHFYQKLAFAYYQRLLPRKYRKHWFGFSLDAIAILFVIETEALQGMFKRELPTELSVPKFSEDFRRMFGLYNEWRRALRWNEQPTADMKAFYELLLLCRGGTRYYRRAYW